ncbi:MAG TPA: two-component sensor histidine kinase [Clostridiales bacterium]|nr:two-component sensor histidine kinase [Clostridiales bacterium]
MKFWQKTFLATLALFLVAFDIGIFMIADLSYRNNVDSEKAKDLGEHHFIAVTMAKDISAIQQRGGETDAALKSLYEYYGSYYEKQAVSLELILDGETVYSNLPPYDGEQPELAVRPGERNIVQRVIDGHTYLFVAGALPEEVGDYLLVYAKNLDSIVTAQQELTRSLLVASVLISAVLALALYILLRRISRPIRKLTAATQRIAAGETGERVWIAGSDEFAQLARSFNHMADEVENQLHSLETESTRKQQFIDNLAHELRTPLTSISGYADYIQKATITDDDKITATGYIISESNRMKEIAYKLMDMAVLRETGIQSKEIDIEDLLDRSLAAADVKAVDKKVWISADIHDRIKIRGDIDLLQSLLVNLIDNAVKACDEGDKVLVRTYYDGDGNACVSIQDNGPGLTEEQLEHITQPFFRVDKARSRQAGGAGLGLSLCKQIADCHHARLVFQSKQGVGTRVIIVFPDEQTELAPPRIEERPARRRERT